LLDPQLTKPPTKSKRKMLMIEKRKLQIYKQVINLFVESFCLKLAKASYYKKELEIVIMVSIVAQNKIKN